MSLPDKKIIEQYWVKRLSDIQDKTELFSDNGYNNKKGIISVKDNIDKEINIRISKISNNDDLVKFTFLLACLKILIHKYFSSNEISIVSKTINDDLVLYSSRIMSEFSVKQTINTIKDNILKDFNYSKHDFYKSSTIKNLGGNHNKLTDYSQVIAKYNRLHDTDNFETDFNFNINFLEKNDQLFIELKAKKGSCSVTDARNLLERYHYLLELIFNNSDLPLRRLSIISNDEKKDILDNLNNTYCQPTELCVLSQFKEQVSLNPDKIAIVCNNNYYTYKELDNKSDIVYSTLRLKGISENEIIPIILDTSFEYVCCILGILKLNALFLPIDISFPIKRKKYIIKECNANIIITTKNLSNVLNFKGIVLVADEIILKANIQNIPIDLNVNRSNDYICIIYTSGTTGNPKGVVIKHKSIQNYVKWTINETGISSEDKTVINTSLAFDAPYTLVFGALLTGAELHLLKREVYLSANKFTRYILNRNISYLKLTPSLFNTIVSCELFTSSLGKSLKFIMLGGEAIIPKDVENALRTIPGIRIMNHYGPTETTIGSVTQNISLENINSYITKPSIGKPLYNTKVYVVDKYNNLLPKKIKGELLIAGNGLAGGYLNNIVRTNERFIKSKLNDNEVLYKSGDIGYIDDSNDIVLVGRIDDQIKLNGYRIELSEIRQRINEFNDILDSAVIVIENKEKQSFISAYFTASGSIKVKDLYHYLESYLPNYMLPSNLVQIDSIPFTAHNKVDRKKLLSLSANTFSESKVISKSLYNVLLEIWRKVLVNDNIQANDNFFSIGGDSIKSLQIIAQLNEHGYKATIQDIFNNPTVSSLQEVISSKNKHSDQKNITGIVPLTPIQRRFFSIVNECPQHYNNAIVLQSTVNIDKTIIDQIVNHIFEHHDALRMQYYFDENDSIIQKNLGLELKPNIYHYDLSDQKNSSKEFIRIANILHSEFKFNGKALFTAAHFKFGMVDRLLLISHHLIIDGVSWRILAEDIESLYNQIINDKKPKLSLKSDSYKIWSEALYNQVVSQNHDLEIDYWKKIYDCQNKFKLKSNQKFLVAEFRRLELKLTKEDTELLQKYLHDILGINIEEFLIILFVLMLSRYTNEKAIIIDIEGHGREQIESSIDVSRTIGWFTSVYPAFFYLTRSEIFDQIKEIKNSISSIPNKGIGYGMLNYLTHKNQELFNCSPNYQFNYLGQFEKSSKNGAFSICDINAGKLFNQNLQTSYNLLFTGLIINKELKINFNYSKEKYSEESIILLSNLFKTISNEVLSLLKVCIKSNNINSFYKHTDLSRSSIESIDTDGEIEEILPLTPMQENMLFYSLLHKDSLAHHSQMSFDLKGTLDINLLKECFTELSLNHEILRTVFLYRNIEEPVQIILKSKPPNLNVYDFRGYSKDILETKLHEVTNQQRIKKYDLSSDPLFRLTIVKFSNCEYRIIWNHHHIILDGWSISILIEDLLKTYFERSINPDIQAQRNIHLVAYIKELKCSNSYHAKRYWRTYLNNFKPYTNFRALRKIDNSNGDESRGKQNLVISDTASSLFDLASRNQTTINIVLQTIWAILLRNFANRDDIVFGTIVSGRHFKLKEIEKLAGNFVNALPLRIRFNKDTTFSDLLNQIQEDYLNGEQYSHFPIGEITSNIDQKIFDHTFVFENYPIDDIDKKLEQNANADKCEITNFNNFIYSVYDYSIIIGAHKEKIFLSFEYNTKIFTKENVQLILDEFLRITQLINGNSDFKIVNNKFDNGPFVSSSTIFDDNKEFAF